MKSILIILVILSSLKSTAQHVDGALYKGSGKLQPKGAYVKSTDIKIVKSPKQKKLPSNESNLNSPFSVNPNPSSDKLFLNNLFNYKILSIVIYDENSKQVLNSDLLSNASNLELNISALKPGNYFLFLGYENENPKVEIFSTKFIKL